jgi:hypothetical protein
MANLYKSLILLVIFSMSGQVALAAGALVEAIGGADAVSVQRSGKELTLKKGDSLEIGDEVVTGRNIAVDIRFDDKTLIRVGANSSYKLESESKGLFHRLLSGIVRVLVPPSPDSKVGFDRFRMNTPEGTIGVRGTEFVVIAAKGQTTLKGLEGEVLFGASDADFGKEGSYVSVKKGYQSSVSKGGKPLAPSPFPLAKYLKEIDGRGGVFGALSARTGTPVKARSAVVAKAAPKAVAAPTPLKPKVKAMSMGTKKEEAKEAEQDPDDMLFLAASIGDIEKTKAAIKKGADVNSRHINQNTALHAASVQSKYDIMKLLVESGADVNAKNQDGLTPLMMVAFETGDAKAAVLLLDSKARVNEKDRSGVTALDLAKDGYEKNKEVWQDIFDLLTEESKKP